MATNVTMFWGASPAIDLGSEPGVIYYMDARQIVGVSDGETLASDDVSDLSDNNLGFTLSMSNVTYRATGFNGHPCLEGGKSPGSTMRTPNFAKGQPVAYMFVMMPTDFTFGRWYTDGGGSPLLGLYENSGDLIESFHGAGGFQSFSHRLPAGIGRLIDWRLEGTNGYMIHELNPVQQGSIGSGTGLPNGLTFFSAQGGGSNSSMKLGAVFVYDPAIIDADRRILIRRQLIRDFDIEMNGQLIICGSSQSSSPTWIDAMIARINGGGVLNIRTVTSATGGQTSLQQDAAFTSQHLHEWVHFFNQMFVSLDGGCVFNDFIGQDGGGAHADGAATYAHYKQFFDNRIAGGYLKKYLIAWTCAYSTALTPEQDAGRIAHNVLMRANWPSFAGALFDVEADTDIGPPASPPGDGTHFITAQNAIITEKIADIIEGISATSWDDF